MKTITSLITSFLIFTFNLSAQKAQQEVLIVGTMHTVPKIVKRSYKPMLRRAKKYNPTSIYVESPRGNDTLSWEYLKDGWSQSYKAFYYLSDSIRNVFTPDSDKFNSIIKKNFSKMSKKDIDFLLNSFVYKRDNANYEFYNYIKKHGTNGSNKPTRHEDGDLTYKLALVQNIKLLTSMDDQRTNGEYHKAWNKCII